MAFPQVQTTATTGDSAAATSHTVTLPSGITSGDLLLIFIGLQASSTLGTVTGWTKFASAESVQPTIGWYYRQADGSEGSTVAIGSGASTKAASVAYRITGAQDPATQAPQASTASTAASNAPDTNSITPTGGAKDYLWLSAINQINGSITHTAPTNYTNTLTVAGTGGASTTRGTTSVSQRELNSTSEDPGAWSSGAATQWRGLTAVVHPTSTQTLSGTLYQNAPTFFTGTVSGDQTLTGTLYANTPSFFTGDLSSTLTGTLFASTPTFFAGVVARTLGQWKADALSLNDGDPVDTWPDSSGAGNNGTGTTTTRPLYKQNVRQGLPAVRFDGTDDYIAIDGIASTLTGADKPFTVFVVARSALEAANHNYFTLERTTSSIPVHEIFRNASTTRSNFRSLRRDDANVQVSTDVQAAHVGGKAAIVMESFTGTTTTGRVNGIRKWKNTAYDVGTATFDSASLGKWRRANLAPLDGDIFEVLVYDQALPESVQDSVGASLSAKWGIPWGPYNASSDLTIPAPSSQTSVIHPCVVKFSTAWHGYTHWMAFTPYTGENPDTEEPCVVASNDGTTWEVPTGGSNPITADPTPGYMADTHLVYDPDTDRLYLFYHRNDATAGWIESKNTSDGITWSSPTIVVTNASNTSEFINPSVVRNPDAASSARWRMYYCDNSNAPTTRLIRFKDSASPDSGYGSSTTITITPPRAVTNWNQNINAFYRAGIWYLLLSDGADTGGTAGDLFFCTSVDGTTFDVFPSIIDHSDIDFPNTRWDEDSIYRCTCVIGAHSVEIWYSAFTDVGATLEGGIGYTTVPLGVADIPELAGNLFTSTATFFAGAVSGGGAGPQTLSGALYQNIPTFFVGSISATYTLSGSLFSSAPTFFTGTIGTAITLGGTLYQNAPSFFTGNVSGVGSPQTLSGVLFSKAPTFFTGATTYTLSGTLFTKAPTFFVGTLTVGPVTLSGVLFSSTPSFPQGVVVAGILGQPVDHPEAVEVVSEGRAIVLVTEGVAT